MDLATILTFVALGGGVLFVGGIALIVRQASRHASLLPGMVLSVLGLIVGAAFFSLRSSLVIIGPSEVAVVFQSVGGNVSTNSLWSEPLGPGAHIVVPGINTTIIYSTETRNYTMSRSENEGAKVGDDAVAVRTNDAQQVYVDVSVLYAIDPANVNALFLKFRQRYEEDFVRPTVLGIVRNIVSGYKAEDMYGPKRIVIQQQLNDAVNHQFADTGLVLKELLIRNITFSPEFINAIEAKQVAEQNAAKAQQEADRVRILAQGKADASVLEAQGQSDATVAKAKGDADANLLLSAANAKALALIDEQLKKNPQLIQWRYIESLAKDIQLILLPGQSGFPFGNPVALGTPTAAPTISAP